MTTEGNTFLVTDFVWTCNMTAMHVQALCGFGRKHLDISLGLFSLNSHIHYLKFLWIRMKHAH